jgi:hypothetical protein
MTEGQNLKLKRRSLAKEGQECPPRAPPTEANKGIEGKKGTPQVISNFGVCKNYSMAEHFALPGTKDQRGATIAVPDGAPPSDEHAADVAANFATDSTGVPVLFLKPGQLSVRSGHGVDHQVKSGQNEQREDGGADESADDDDGEGPLDLRADGVGKGHWQESEHGEQRGHEHRAEAGLRAFEHGQVRRAPGLAQAFRSKRP